MPINSIFKTVRLKDVDDNWTILHTQGAGTTSYFIQLDIASKGAGVQVSVRLYDSVLADYIYQVNLAPVPAGSALQVLAGQKLVLAENDRLEVICHTPSETVDVVGSFIDNVNE